MNNKIPLLTIAIPTYNRPERVKNQILKILPFLSDEIYLLVLDNHSDVPVSSLFEGIILPPNVTIIRNKFNVGGDANIARCFEYCSTSWLWTLSDDDELTNDAVNIVLGLIKATPNAIFINLNRKDNYIGEGIDSFVKHALTQYSYLFWMSVCVYHIDALKNQMNDYFSSISCMQPGVVLLLKSLFLDNKSLFVLSDKKTIENGDKDISWDRTRFIYSSLFLKDLLSLLLPNYSRIVEKAIIEMCYNSVVTQYRMDRHLFKALRLSHTIWCRKRKLKSILSDFYYYSFTQLRLIKSFIIN